MIQALIDLVSTSTNTWETGASRTSTLLSAVRYDRDIETTDVIGCVQLTEFLICGRFIISIGLRRVTAFAIVVAVARVDLASTSAGVITSVLVGKDSGRTHVAGRSRTLTAWLRSTMQCSCHTSHTFVPRTRPVAASSLQLTSSFQGSQVSHARFAGSPLQCKPIRSSGRQHRCVTSMASKGQSSSKQLPLPACFSFCRA